MPAQLPLYFPLSTSTPKCSFMGENNSSFNPHQWILYAYPTRAYKRSNVSECAGNENQKSISWVQRGITIHHIKIKTYMHISTVRKEIFAKGCLDEMVGWHHWPDGHEFEQAPGVGGGQGSLACCSPWGRKETDGTEQLNWKEEGTQNVSNKEFVWNM